MSDPTGEALEQSELEQLRTQKDAAYSERNKVLAAFARLALDVLRWRVQIAPHNPRDLEWEDDWRNVLVIESPCQGQMTWHIHDSEVALFEGIPRGTYEWDGHSTPEKYQRLHECLRGQDR